ncbi:BspA family leucine-rich repeat surface protein [Campylobacter fetus subsp. venerealis]|uniref:BspA family leucine-rich repeat surface protein n=1 Tax=Campylobacter fetus TaxID=196 RepID=UPI00190B70C3|nr:BspA family leucine-rich repeat surface protein [Campylobacter fetus]MBK3487657.1 BspA family leucine-rich repeat surface protein [Campylobacter fetus subsp. venerealis]
MSYMFAYTKNFNSDLSNWDVSSVKYMDWMFYEARNFNSDISNCDVAKKHKHKKTR